MALKQLDVSGVEKWREYVFPDGFTYKVNDPSVVHISESGSHRVVDKDGLAHYISAGWKIIRWHGQVVA